MIAVAMLVIGRVTGKPACTIEIEAAATFLVLSVLAFTPSTSFVERWTLPLSNGGILLAALAGALIGKPFGNRTTSRSAVGEFP